MGRRHRRTLTCRKRSPRICRRASGGNPGDSRCNPSTSRGIVRQFRPMLECCRTSMRRSRQRSGNGRNAARSSKRRLTVLWCPSALFAKREPHGGVMRFETKHRIQGTPSEVEQSLLDERYLDYLLKHHGILLEVQLLEKKDDGDILRRKVRYRPKPVIRSVPNRSHPSGSPSSRIPRTISASESSPSATFRPRQKSAGCWSIRGCCEYGKLQVDKPSAGWKAKFGLTSLSCSNRWRSSLSD